MRGDVPETLQNRKVLLILEWKRFCFKLILWQFLNWDFSETVESKQELFLRTPDIDDINL